MRRSDDCAYFSLSQSLFLTVFGLSNFFKRIMEVCFLHKFSGSTYAVRNIPKICVFHGMMTAWMAFIINHPHYYPPRNLQVLLASFFFLIAEFGSLSIHFQLKNNFKNRSIQNPSWNPFTWLYTRSYSIF